VLLRDVIAASPESFGREADIDLLFRNIDSSQQELREKGLATAGVIYSERPRSLIKGLGNLWKIWRLSA
jgi:hypothetical protein